MELSVIGYFTKTHGVKGQLILRVETDFFTDQLKALFVETATGKAPYFISELKETNSGIIISLEDIDAIEKAKSFVGKKVFIDSKLIDEDTDAENWIGFDVVDKTYGALGKVVGMTDNGEQTLVSLEFKGREIILPLVDEFIEKIDEDEKKIFFNAPEGLIDVYLSDGPHSGEDDDPYAV